MERNKYDRQIERITMEFRHMNDELLENGRQLVYENQEEAAFQCFEHFKNGAQVVSLVAQPGTGKTGTIHKLMIFFAIGTPEMRTLCEDMFLACGMSEIGWVEQTKMSIISSFRDNVFHRMNFNSKLDSLRKARNGLLSTDECHIASGKNMTISKSLKEVGLLDVNVLESRNMRLLEVSATPEGVQHDLRQWGDKAKIVMLKPGTKYKGFQHMLDDDRIMNAPDIDTYDKVLYFLKYIEIRYVETTPKFVLIRTENSELRELIRKACKTLRWNKPISHDSDKRVTNIDNMMSTPPSRHTVILVKSFWRASKRVIYNNVGATYEKTKKRDTTSTSQGLTARFCNTFEYTGDQVDVKFRPIHFCDKGAIEQYLAWFNSGCDYSSVEYEAPRMKSKNGKVKCQETKVNHHNVKNLEVEEEDDLIERNYEISSSKFNTVQEARAWVSENLTYTASEYKLCSSNGLDGNTHFRYRGGLREILNESQLRETTDMGQGANTSGRIMPVSVDVSSGIADSARIMPIKSNKIINYVVIYKREKLKTQV
jgi:hypothetical protein